MSLLLAWVLFPLALAAVGAGWGTLLARAAGVRVGALLVPLGLAGALVLAALLTAWSPLAPSAVPVVGVGAAGGLLLAWRARPWRGLRERREDVAWPALATLGALLLYAAPVLLSGSATFAGYVRLDDTSTWLAMTDQALAHGRSLASLAPSTYRLLLAANVSGGYPLGAFMLLGIGHGLTGIDSAWVFQPYLACCGAAVALGIYALCEPLIASPRSRALVAFLGAQPALLYGYSLWGGIKELTAAFLLVTGVALVAPLLTRRPESPRALLAPAIPAAALIVTLGTGAGAWIAPALLCVALAWGLARRELGRAVRDLALLGAVVAVLAIPLWVTLSSVLGAYSGLTPANVPVSETLGNLIQPLSGWQLAGVWPIGDFRLRAPILATALLVALVLIAAALAIWLTLRRRRHGVALYVAVVLSACVIGYLANSTPWVEGKALAISSPALLVAALIGGVLLARRWAPVGALVLVALGGGVLWSNALAYHDVLLAPRARLAELAHIGGLVAGRGPTLIGEYEVYADRHFLRAGAPTEPAEYRSVTLPLLNGAILTKSAWADLDSFAPATLAPYRSLVVARSPAESRPPTPFERIWRGRYYELWQQPAHPARRLLEHVPFGESNALPYCGVAQNRPETPAPLCSANPVATPPCAQIERLGVTAAREHARLLAYQRPEPIVARGDQTRWPAAWGHEAASRTLYPTTPGTALAQIRVYGNQRYELFLGGSFARGFHVSVDGREVGRVKDQLLSIGGYAPVAEVFLTPGVHTFALTYPHADLTPGSGDNQQTSLAAISLEPLSRPATQLLEVAPARARRLCGRPLDWLEIVAPTR